MLKYTVPFLLIFFMCSHSWSAGPRRGTFESTKIGITQQIYSGPARTSFSEGSPAYGLELSVDNGGSYFRYFFKTRFNMSSGSQNFTKSGTVYFSKYDYISFEPEIGLAFFPVARDDQGLNIYLWGTGSISYNNLSLKTVPSTVNVDAKSQEFGWGYGAGLGFEYVLSKSKGRTGNRMSLYSEVGFRNTNTPLAGTSSFQVSGMTISLGLGF